MWEFLQRNRIGLAATLLFVLSLLLMTSSARSTERAAPLSRLVLEVLRPLQFAAAVGWGTVERVWNGYIDLLAVRRENEFLRRRVAELERQAVLFAEMAETDRRLSELLKFRVNLVGDAQAALIIGRDPFPSFGTVVISKGSSDGIQRGMAVVAPQGIVGRTLSVAPHASRVLLITDHNSGVDALVQRTRARGVVEGTVDGRCLMKYLKREEDVAVGDRVVTSGLDGIFPKGLVVGEVVHVTKGTRGLLQVAEVRPAAPLNDLEEVLVLAPGAQWRGSEVEKEAQNRDERQPR
jgi:rod shape-determining protein MreC